jgi:hypothetical protein
LARAFALDEAARDGVVDVIRSGCQCYAGLLGTMRAGHKGYADLFERPKLAATAFVGLPAKSTEASPEISRVLADSKLPVALLWQDFRDAEGNGSIDWLTLLPALRGIGGLAFKAEEAINQRSRIEPTVFSSMAYALKAAGEWRT